MHTFSTMWVGRFIILSVVLNPMLVMGGTKVVPLASAPVIWAPGVPLDRMTPAQIRPASQPLFVLERIHKRAITVLAPTHKLPAGIPASYTSSQPRILRAEALTPRIDDPTRRQTRTTPNLFIGPTQESRKPVISKHQKSGPTIAFSDVSRSPLFPESRPSIALRAVPQLSASEFYRMNQATREILHGGN